MHPLARLEQAFETRGAIVAGVLSGTSADGIDVALCRMHAREGLLARPELLAFETLAFEAGLAATVDWYKANVPWWQHVRSGAYRDYYDRQYAVRLAAGTTR